MSNVFFIIPYFIFFYVSQFSHQSTGVLGLTDLALQSITSNFSPTEPVSHQTSVVALTCLHTSLQVTP